MDDARIWEFEESLWKADAGRYHELIEDDCVMVVPAPPYILSGRQAADAVSDTPRWQEVRFSEQRVSRPQEGLIVIGYRAEATRDDAEPYVAHCTTVMRRLSHEEWRVVQHQQTPPLVMKG